MEERLLSCFYCELTSLAGSPGTSVFFQTDFRKKGHPALRGAPKTCHYTGRQPASNAIFPAKLASGSHRISGGRHVPGTWIVTLDPDRSQRIDCARPSIVTLVFEEPPTSLTTSFRRRCSYDTAATARSWPCRPRRCAGNIRNTARAPTARAWIAFHA